MNQAGKILTFLLTLVLLVGLVGVVTGCSEDTATDTSSSQVTDPLPLEAKTRLRVATTTSLYDTGLWGYLEPMFEDKYGVEVDVLYAGTGKAIELGQRGDVDVITVHSKSREIAFCDEGYGVERVPFAYNYFLVVGPEFDPAGIKGMSPEDAFKTLIEKADASFISRGDDSGTHSKEKSIWAGAGYTYEDVQSSGTWYIEAGAGMGPTLTMANEKLGYTLSDMGTYLAYKSDLALEPIVDEGSILLNVYSAIAVNPENVSVKNMELANKLIDFLVSAEIQELIGKYGVSTYGLQLFTPCAGNEPSN